MNLKTTIVAAAILAAMGAYIYFYEREPVASDTDSERVEVFDLKAEDLREIEIRRGEGDTVKLEKEGDAWKLLEPVAAPADSSEVGTLARNIAELERQRIVAEGEGVRLEDFGLDRPELEVSFRTEGADAPQGFALGEETPTGTNRYARLSNRDEVFVIPSYLKSNFDKSAWDLRDRKVLRFERDDVERVVLRRSEGELVLARQNEDQWNVATPTFCRADRYKASSLVSRFETAKMEEIVSESPEDLQAYGLAKPSYEADLQLKGGKSAKLVIGDEKDGRFYAMNPDHALVYLVESSLVDEIKKDASEYRSKRLFDYATYQVDKIQIVPAEGPTRIYEKRKEGEEDQWAETAPESRNWDRGKVEDLLYKMNGTDADDFAGDPVDDPARFALDHPAFTVTIWSKEGAYVEELIVARPEGDWVYARRKGDEPVLKIKASDWDEIVKLMDFESEPEEAEKGEAKE